MSNKTSLVGKRAADEAVKVIQEIKRISKELQTSFDEWERVQHGTLEDRDPWLKTDPRMKLTEKKLSKMLERKSHDTDVMSGKKRIREQVMHLKQKLGTRTENLRDLKRGLLESHKFEGRPLTEVASECLDQAHRDQERITELGIHLKQRARDAMKVVDDSELQRHEEWASTTIALLANQLEDMEATLQSKAALPAQDPERETLRAKVDRHRWHIEHLERLRRALNQLVVAMDETLESVEDRVENYVNEAWSAPVGKFFREFDEEDLYEDLDLPSLECLRTEGSLERGGVLLPSVPPQLVEVHNKSRLGGASGRGTLDDKVPKSGPPPSPNSSGIQQKDDATSNSKGYPLRLGIRECPVFMKTGACAYNSKCKWHHPERHGKEKQVSSGAPELALNSEGCPFRPGASLCNHFVQTGRCALKASCKFHHPEPSETTTPSPSAVSSKVWAFFELRRCVQVVLSMHARSSGIEAGDFTLLLIRENPQVQLHLSMANLSKFTELWTIMPEVLMCKQTENRVEVFRAEALVGEDLAQPSGIDRVAMWWKHHLERVRPELIGGSRQEQEKAFDCWKVGLPRVRGTSLLAVAKTLRLGPHSRFGMWSESDQQVSIGNMAENGPRAARASSCEPLATPRVCARKPRSSSRTRPKITGGREHADADLRLLVRKVLASRPTDNGTRLFHFVSDLQSTIEDSCRSLVISRSGLFRAMREMTDVVSVVEHCSLEWVFAAESREANILQYCNQLLSGHVRCWMDKFGFISAPGFFEGDIFVHATQLQNGSNSLPAGVLVFFGVGIQVNGRLIATSIVERQSAGDISQSSVAEVARAWALRLGGKRQHFMGASEAHQKAAFHAWNPQAATGCGFDQVLDWLMSAGPSFTQYCPREAVEILIVGGCPTAKACLQQTKSSCSVLSFSGVVEAFAHLDKFLGVRSWVLCARADVATNIEMHVSKRSEIPSDALVILVGSQLPMVKKLATRVKIVDVASWEAAMSIAGVFVKQHSCNASTEKVNTFASHEPDDKTFSSIDTSCRELTQAIFAVCDFDMDGILSKDELRPVAQLCMQDLDDGIWNEAFSFLLFETDSEGRRGLDVEQLMKVLSDRSSGLYCSNEDLSRVLHQLRSNTHSDVRRDQRAGCTNLTSTSSVASASSCCADAPNAVLSDKQEQNCRAPSVGDGQKGKVPELGQEVLQPPSQPPPPPPPLKQGFPPPPSSPLAQPGLTLSSASCQCPQKDDLQTQPRTPPPLTPPKMPPPQPPKPCEPKSYLEPLDETGVNNLCRHPLELRSTPIGDNQGCTTAASQTSPCRQAISQLPKQDDGRKARPTTPLGPRAKPTPAKPPPLGGPQPRISPNVSGLGLPSAPFTPEKLKAIADGMFARGTSCNVDGTIKIELHQVREDIGAPSDGFECSVQAWMLADSDKYLHKDPPEYSVKFGDGEVCDALEFALCQMWGGDIASVACYGRHVQQCPVLNATSLASDEATIFVIRLISCRSQATKGYNIDAMMKFLDARKEVGNQLFNKGRFELALHRYTTISTYFKAELQGEPRSRWMTCGAEGLNRSCQLNEVACMLKLGRFDLAKVVCDMVLAEDATNLKALYRRASALFELGDSPACMNDLKRVLNRDANNKDAHCLLGRVRAAKQGAGEVPKHSSGDVSDNKDETFEQAQESQALGHSPNPERLCGSERDTITLNASAASSETAKLESRARLSSSSPQTCFTLTSAPTSPMSERHIQQELESSSPVANSSQGKRVQQNQFAPQLAAGCVASQILECQVVGGEVEVRSQPSVSLDSQTPERPTSGVNAGMPDIGLMAQLREVMEWKQDGLLTGVQFQEVKRLILMQNLDLPKDFQELIAWKQEGMINELEFEAAKDQLLKESSSWQTRRTTSGSTTASNVDVVSTASEVEQEETTESLVLQMKAARINGSLESVQALISKVELCTKPWGSLKKTKNKLLRELHTLGQEHVKENAEYEGDDTAENQQGIRIDIIVQVSWSVLLALMVSLRDSSAAYECTTATLQTSARQSFLEFQQAVDGLRDIVHGRASGEMDVAVSLRDATHQTAVHDLDMWTHHLRAATTNFQILKPRVVHAVASFCKTANWMSELGELDMYSKDISDTLVSATTVVAAVDISSVCSGGCETQALQDSFRDIDRVNLDQSIDALAVWGDRLRDELEDVQDALEHKILKAIWHSCSACHAFTDLIHQAASHLEDAEQRLQALNIEKPAAALHSMAEAQECLKLARRRLKEQKRRLEDAKESLEDNDDGAAADVAKAEVEVQASRRDAQDQEYAMSQSMLRLWRLQEAHFPELLSSLVEKVADQLVKEALISLKPSDRPKVTAMLLTDRKHEFYGDLEELGGRHEVFRGVYAGSACVLKKVSLSTREGMKCFVREVRWLTKFSLSKNQYTVPLRGFFVEGKHGFLHFDAYPSDLEAWASDHVGMPVVDLQRVVRELVVAVQYIHSASFVHGDIKPKNVLMDGDSRPLLCDFEFGRELRGTATERAGVTSLALVGWSHGFVAPELCQNNMRDPQKQPTKESDVYSLGKTLKTLVDVVQPMGDMPALLALVERMLCADPSDRVTASTAVADVVFADLHIAPSPADQQDHYSRFSPPSYWTSQQLDIPFRVITNTEYMRRQIEEALFATDHCGILSKAKVVSVKRVETQWLWMSYVTKRERMRAQIQRHKGHQSPWPQPLTPLKPPPLATLDAEVNEVYLWHGCPADVVKPITQDGFDERLAASCLYGTGVYFTPQACKALQYARADGCSIRHKRCGKKICTCPGPKYLLYSRVCLGVPFYAKKAMKDLRRPPQQEFAGCRQPVPCDSVVANPGVAKSPTERQEHRECVIWNHAGMQAYAEFIVELDLRP
mmetsp:Transcript_108063/g.345100  ORF Transcript_108063/g.345100 Transcript_108063/m.345100 type:complete len:2853 (+) Transcript_108063:122-8680(+)